MAHDPDDAAPEHDPDDPFGLSKMLGQLGFGSGQGGADMLAQLQQLMSSSGPVNWQLATQLARGAIDAADQPVREHEGREIADAGRLADLWLDPVTTLPAPGLGPQAWTRREWLEQTLASWKQLVDPVAGRVTAAMGSAMQKGLLSEGMLEGLPPELASLVSGLGPNPFATVMDQMGAVVFGAQVGMALGALASEVLSTGEIGVPLGRSALLPGNIAAFAEGLEIPLDEVRLYLALREAAHQRLFEQVPWLRAHLYDAVDAYARGIEVDPAAIERAVASFDPENPAALQEALASGGAGMFELEQTPAQKAALGRLELALALVEGWVDLVVDEASSATLPHAQQLRETVRRRRAAGGPAEQTFATLVGLQLRPRRLREAAALWSALTASRGIEGRDALWAHPDLLPGADDLDDPEGWAAGTPGAGEGETHDWDAGLQALGNDPPGGPAEDPDPGSGSPPDDAPA
jgi:putative hydrolase